MEVGFLLLPCVSQGLNSDNQICECIPFSTEPSFQSCFWFLLFEVTQSGLKLTVAQIGPRQIAIP